MLKKLDAKHRARLFAIADIIVPRIAEMPSAGDIDLANSPINRVLRTRPDLLEPLVEALDAIRDETNEVGLRAMRNREPRAFAVLFQAIAGAYYMDARVRRLLGYDGQRALSLPKAGFGAEELLMEMMESPPRYRDC